jgi:hypothetical protein
MNTTPLNTSDTIALAETYYSAMLAKDFVKMASCLHSHVRLVSPLSEIHGKDAVVSAAQNLSEILQDIRIRARFAAPHQIMLAYDFMFPAPMGKLRAAVLMEFTEGLISGIELFYDGRPFEDKKGEIFEAAKS